jgi:hypothetical protein
MKIMNGNQNLSRDKRSPREAFGRKKGGQPERAASNEVCRNKDYPSRRKRSRQVWREKTTSHLQGEKPTCSEVDNWESLVSDSSEDDGDAVSTVGSSDCGQEGESPAPHNSRTGFSARFSSTDWVRRATAVSGRTCGPPVPAAAPPPPPPVPLTKVVLRQARNRLRTVPRAPAFLQTKSPLVAAPKLKRTSRKPSDFSGTHTKVVAGGPSFPNELFAGQAPKAPPPPKRSAITGDGPASIQTSQDVAQKLTPRLMWDDDFPSMALVRLLAGFIILSLVGELVLEHVPIWSGRIVVLLLLALGWFLRKDMMSLFVWKRHEYVFEEANFEYLREALDLRPDALSVKELRHGQPFVLPVVYNQYFLSCVPVKRVELKVNLELFVQLLHSEHTSLGSKEDVAWESFRMRAWRMYHINIDRFNVLSGQSEVSDTLLVTYAWLKNYFRIRDGCPFPSALH